MRQTFWMILIAVFLIPHICRSQVLLEMRAADLQAAGIESVRGFRAAENTILVETETVSEAERWGIPYSLLDSDMETAVYYWTEPAPGAKALQMELPGRVVWRGERGLLFRAVGSLPVNIGWWTREVQFVPIPVRTAHFPPPLSRKAARGVVQSVLDSVNLSRLVYTEEHISGEKPYIIQGQPDSIQTRYSLSPQIVKSEQYLKMRFEDYGYSVDLQPFTTAKFYDVKFSPGQPQKGWLCGVDKIWGTADGGQNWSIQYSGSAGVILWSLFSLDSQIAFAVGDNATILKTTNGGVSWQPQSSPTGLFLFGIFFIDATTGWICGDNGLIMKTTDGGQSWSIKSTPISDRLYDIFFVDASTGWAVGRNGRILRSTNGGETWSHQTSNTSERLYGVFFRDNSNGFAVGWNGTLLSTSNSGLTWSPMNTPTNDNLYDLDFTGADSGMIAGFNGICLTTTNGGGSWNLAGNILNKDMYGLDLKAGGDAWSTGAGMVASSTDFGQSWQSKLGSVTTSGNKNLVVLKNGTTYPDQYYIICAHYDCTSGNPMVRAPGADDNGSGTSTVLEAARVLQPYNFKYSIKFILFAGEEQGLYGSAAYAANAAASGEQILGVLNLDMTGYDSNFDSRFEIHAGTQSNSQAVGSQVLTNLNAWNLPLIAEYQTSGSSGASDHASFWNYGFPAIMVIEDFQDFNAYYHSVNDLLANMNHPYFHEIAKLCIGSLAAFAQPDTTTALSGGEMSPGDFAVFQPWPNPFNPTVRLEYQLTTAGVVTVDIFDLTGRRVRRLSQASQLPGRHRVEWDGYTDSGTSAASGLYLIRVEAGRQQTVRKLFLMR